MSNLNLSDNEKRDIQKYLTENKLLPDKYRFLLFDSTREVELIWNGMSDDIESSVLPFQTIEHIDEPRDEEKINSQQVLFDTSGKQIEGWSNKLIWGDNKFIISSLKNGPLRKQIEAEGGLKLIYIDPPFDVGADFSMEVEVGENNSKNIFTKKPSVIEEVAYRDTWGKGADSFISMIYERLKLMNDLLSEDGSIYIHCDSRVNSYIRLILDEVFGRENFVNEIAWCYTSGGAGKTAFSKKHDTIYLYSKANKHIFNIQYYKRYALIQEGEEVGFDPRIQYYKDEKGRSYRLNLTLDWWSDIGIVSPNSNTERTDYPTQKPEGLLQRIIETSSNKGDLVADFFCGSGTTLAVAEKLGRKWIGSDLGRFSIHTTRKRMIGVQRELKNAGTDFRPFEILNIGKYEREKYLGINDSLRDEEKRMQRENKEREFIKLILSAYKAEAVNSFNNFVGKKRDRLVAVGSIDTPVTNDFLENIIIECKEKHITKVDILGFDYEMGLDFETTKKLGIDVQFKVIPREVFDKRAIERGQVKFYDVAYIEVKPIIKGRGNEKEVAIELTDFSVFYNQDNTGEVEEKLQAGGSKIVIENGQVIKIFKDKQSGIVERETLTKKWTDWIDYWSVDFEFESKKELINIADPATGREEKKWTGNYIFENEWQSFRTKKNRNLELTSAYKITSKGKMKIAIKVIDIFGNDTTKVIEVNV